MVARICGRHLGSNRGCASLDPWDRIGCNGLSTGDVSGDAARAAEEMGVAMDYAHIGIIVIGGLNTDIAALGVDRLLSVGELTRSGRLLIGPGGKSCNIARMIAPLVASGDVAIVGRTSRDPYGLWRVPLDALRDAGVNSDFIRISDFEESGEYPGVALIPVDARGRNQIYCLPGVNDLFLPEDIDGASPLFEGAGSDGMLAMSLELPLGTAVHAVGKAVSLGMRVVVDPGGMDTSRDYRDLIGPGIFLLKPNEHEARMLTGVEVADMSTAREAARFLRAAGVANVVITHGTNGAYVFSSDGREEHIPAPEDVETETADETGCGDQVTAVLCAELSRGRGVLEASAAAVRAGTMQYGRPGIAPVTRGELDAAI